MRYRWTSKSEIRISKSETNPNIEIQNTKQVDALFRISVFGFRVCFGFRISIFGFLKYPRGPGAKPGPRSRRLYCEAPTGVADPKPLIPVRWMPLSRRVDSAGFPQIQHTAELGYARHSTPCGGTRWPSPKVRRAYSKGPAFCLDQFLDRSAGAGSLAEANQLVVAKLADSRGATGKPAPKQQRHCSKSGAHWSAVIAPIVAIWTSRRCAR
jgi:hypothetical protein